VHSHCFWLCGLTALVFLCISHSKKDYYYKSCSITHNQREQTTMKIARSTLTTHKKLSRDGPRPTVLRTTLNPNRRPTTSQPTNNTSLRSTLDNVSNKPTNPPEGKFLFGFQQSFRCSFFLRRILLESGANITTGRQHFWHPLTTCIIATCTTCVEMVTRPFLLHYCQRAFRQHWCTLNNNGTARKLCTSILRSPDMLCCLSLFVQTQDSKPILSSRSRSGRNGMEQLAAAAATATAAAATAAAATAALLLLPLLLCRGCEYP